jgi:hypothetical protein
MAKQRYINTRFWDDSYVIDLDPIEKLLFIYFLTNPLTSIVGAYEISARRIAFDTGIDRDMVPKILKRFEESGKIFYVDGWIVIKNFIKHQSINPKIVSGIRNELMNLPAPVRSVVAFEYEPQSKPVRKKVTKYTRKRIIARDGGKCLFCSATEDLEIDHIVPVVLGGGGEDENLRTLCRSCNGKRNAELRWNKDGSVESRNSLPTEMGGLPHLILSNSNSTSTSSASGTVGISGRAGIQRNYIPINPSSDLETWLCAIASQIGAKDAASMPNRRKWEDVCLILIREDRDLTAFLKVVQMERDRNAGTPHFFSPDGCLKVMQLSGVMPKEDLPTADQKLADDAAHRAAMKQAPQKAEAL